MQKMMIQGICSVLLATVLALGAILSLGRQETQSVKLSNLAAGCSLKLSLLASQPWPFGGWL